MSDPGDMKQNKTKVLSSRSLQSRGKKNTELTPNLAFNYNSCKKEKGKKKSYKQHAKEAKRKKQDVIILSTYEKKTNKPNYHYFEMLQYLANNTV